MALLFIFVAVTTFFPLVTATSHYWNHSCSGLNFSSESSYKTDRDNLLGSLSSNVGNTGFYNASMGEANAIVLCRADMELDKCRSCITNATKDILQRCPVQYQAVIWYECCMVRYSNKIIFGKLATDPRIARPTATDAADAEEFKDARRKLMDELRTRIANGGRLRKAAAGSETTFPYNERVYGLVQCTPDLSQDNCTNCLDVGSRMVADCCHTKRGFIVFSPSCILRSELYNFIDNMTRVNEPLKPSPPPLAGKNKDNATRNIVIAVVSFVVYLSLVLCALIIARKRIQQKTKGIVDIGEDGDEISTVESIQYDFRKIRAATDDFSDANKLGRGGFGTVYKGKLQNGREIAVKRLSWGSSQGDLEFKNEVLLVARLQHRNLVRLLGFSTQGIERLLIYEFVRNGSLDHILFDPIKSSNLDWDTRYKIIGGIAKGLLYLHEDSRLRIIHRDLKASNVLLDEEMNPKISDFGMAKLVMPDATEESTSRIVGTYGYMAPEYAIHGQISIKSDIFTFGVLVLEIVNGQKKKFFQNGENSGNHLLSYAWRSWREGTSANIIDTVLMANSGAQQDMIKCIHIALLCVQQNPDNRPTMASVVLMLNSLSLTLPSPSEPGFYMPSISTEASIPHEYNLNETGSNRSPTSVLARPADSSSGNDCSITELYPR